MLSVYTLWLRLRGSWETSHSWLWNPPSSYFGSIGGIIPLPLLVFSWNKSRWKYFAKLLIAATYSQDLSQRLKPKRINPALCQFVYIPCATGRSANKHEIETENQINHVTENESRWTNLLTKIKNIKNSTPPRNGLLLPAIIHAWPRAFPIPIMKIVIIHPGASNEFKSWAHKLIFNSVFGSSTI